VAEYSAPLPEGDAGLIEAERRLRECYPQRKALYREFKISMEIEAEIVNPTVTAAEVQLEEFIEETPPRSLVGAAVKLRALCDKDVGLAAGESEDQLGSLDQVLKFVERKGGEAQP
jgi:hypothetical protein